MSDSPTNPKMTCSECSWRGRSADRLVCENPFEKGTQIYGCPECKKPACFRIVCDEDDCWEKVTRGTPTPSGYRQTCRKHAPEDTKDT